MKPKICLIRCPSIPLPYPPDIGLGYISAVLKRAGFETRVWDLNWRLYFESDPATRQSWRWMDDDNHIDRGLELFRQNKNSVMQEVGRMIKEGYRFFGFSLWRSNRAASLELAAAIKKVDSNAVVVFGGPESMPFWYGKDLEELDFVDAVVHGEGEETILDLVRHWSESGKLESCPGAYVRGASPSAVERLPVDLNTLPIPDFSDYGKAHLERLAITFRRGCPRRCKFCSVPGYIRKFRWRSAEDIVAEMEHQIDRYGIRHFVEASPAVNSNMRELLRLCDLIAERKLEVQWQGFGLFEEALTAEAIRKMHRAGCVGLSFGLESGSQRLLNLMEKQVRINDAERILRDMKREGLWTTIALIVGYPGETEEDFEETANFLRRNAENITPTRSISTLILDPYARLWSEMDKIGLVLSGARHHDAGWHLKDGSNTLAIRLDRQSRLIELTKSLGLWDANLPEVKSEAN